MLGVGALALCQTTINLEFAVSLCDTSVHYTDCIHQYTGNWLPTQWEYIISQWWSIGYAIRKLWAEALAGAAIFFFLLQGWLSVVLFWYPLHPHVKFCSYPWYHLSDLLSFYMLQLTWVHLYDLMMEVTLLWFMWQVTYGCYFYTPM